MFQTTNQYIYIYPLIISHSEAMAHLIRYGIIFPWKLFVAGKLIELSIAMFDCQRVATISPEKIVSRNLPIFLSYFLYPNREFLEW